MAEFLRIALWKANDLAQHKDEIPPFLQQNMIDILLIRETHFTRKSYFKTPQYNICYTNHPDGSAHAGTAVIVKQTISHYELPKYEEDSN
jgi:exonuclease III